MGPKKVIHSDPQLLDAFLVPSLRSANSYKIDAPSVRIKLDQNETPFDWPTELKDEVLNKLRTQAWNRYPSAFAPELNDYLAKYAGVAPENILTGPGTNHLITVFLSAFTRRLPGKVIISQPSFPLYESHCRYEGVPYELWPLGEKFEFDLARLPAMPEYSVLAFASPNNPTGSVLPKKDLEAILKANPTTFVLADEAYFEFSTENYLGLLATYPNLVLLRTCSKTLGAAGVRLGYAIAGRELVAEIGKLRLPYLLNRFTIAATEVFFQSDELQKRVGDHVDLVVGERQRMTTALQASHAGRLEVFPSAANFLLLRLGSEAACRDYYQGLIREGILVRDVSRGPRLANCLRVTVGLPEENDFFLRATDKLLK